ncbi:uncharacterized protein V6R79_001651 [Siganus canaliculatus]
MAEAEVSQEPVAACQAAVLRGPVPDSSSANRFPTQCGHRREDRLDPSLHECRGPEPARRLNLLFDR